MSYTNNWTQIIRQLMTESHTKEELMKLSNAELKKLHGEYSDKDDEKSQDEAKVIKDILDERGDDKEEKLEEGRWSRKTTSKILRDNERVRQIMSSRKPKPKSEEKKEDIKQQNEELLMILDVLCEMVGVDMETLSKRE